MITYH